MIVDCGSSKVPEIAAMLSKKGADVTIKKLSDLSDSEKAFNGVVISGAPILLTEVPHTIYMEKIKPLLLINRPLLGICFGHQILGLLHHAYVARCEEDRSWQEITILHPFGIFEEFNNWVMMREDHTECIDLPEGFRRTAGSVVCGNEAMQHEKYPWYGVQFHPEISGDQGEKLFRNFLNICRSWY